MTSEAGHHVYESTTAHHTRFALRPIRNRLPNLGGIDISPLVLIFAIWIAQQLLTRLYFALAFGQVQGLLL